MRQTVAAALGALTILAACQTTEQTVATGESVESPRPLPAGVPLPDDLNVSPPAADMATGLSRWLGLWTGRWGGELKGVIAVEQIDPPDKARVVYAWADHSPWDITKGWTRRNAIIEGDTMTLEQFTSGAQATFTFKSDGTLSGLYRARGAGSATYGSFYRAQAR